MRVSWVPVFAAIPALAMSGLPHDLSAQTELADLQDEAVEWLQQYIGVNTVNPPGNELRGVAFFAAILEAEGIEYETVETAPGRGNVWARLEGGDEPALILLHHMDVVPADERFWTVDPFAAEVQDGLIYGRGTLDTKTSGILHLAAFISLHRSDTPLRRDVIFMATADEEAGGFFGAGWMVENRPEVFEDVGFVLNEGGGGSVVDGNVQFGVEVTQKVPYWIRLTTTGEPGHGSRPNASSSVTEMIEALDRLRAHSFEARIIPAVATFFRGTAAGHPEPWRSRMADPETALLQPGVLREFQDYDPGLHTLTRNTCSITRLEGSGKINVVPPETSAEIDCRLLPDQDPDAFLAELRGVLGEEVEDSVMIGFTPAITSTDTDLYRALEEVTLAEFPGANFVPRVLGGFTDSHFTRDLGIASYGYSAMAVPQADASGVHGNDERVSVENVRRGVAMTLQLLRRFAGVPGTR